MALFCIRYLTVTRVYSRESKCNPSPFDTRTFQEASFLLHLVCLILAHLQNQQCFTPFLLKRALPVHIVECLGRKIRELLREKSLFPRPYVPPWYLLAGTVLPTSAKDGFSRPPLDTELPQQQTKSLSRVAVFFTK